MNKTKRGGPGRNQGRKAKPDGEKAVTVSVSLTAENAAWLAAQDGPKSHIVNQALDSVRAAQAQEGTLFAHAENPVWQ